MTTTASNLVTAANVETMKFAVDRVRGFKASTTLMDIEECMCLFVYESEEVEMIVWNHCRENMYRKIAEFITEPLPIDYHYPLAKTAYTSAQ